MRGDEKGGCGSCSARRAGDDTGMGHEQEPASRECRWIAHNSPRGSGSARSRRKDRLRTPSDATNRLRAQARQCLCDGLRVEDEYSVIGTYVLSRSARNWFARVWWCAYFEGALADAPASTRFAVNIAAAAIVAAAVTPITSLNMASSIRLQRM